MGKTWIGAILALLASASGWAVEVHDVRLWRAPDNTRIVFDLTGPTEHKLIVLDNPRRIVVDIENASLKSDLGQLQLEKTPISRVRSGVREGDDLRIVLDLSAQVDPRSFALTANEQAGDRLVLDLYDKQSSASSSTCCGRRIDTGARCARALRSPLAAGDRASATRTAAAEAGSVFLLLVLRFAVLLWAGCL